MLDLATNRQLQQHHHNKKTNEKEYSERRE